MLQLVLLPLFILLFVSLLDVQHVEKCFVRFSLIEINEFSFLRIQVDYYERNNGSAIQLVNCSLNFDDRACRSGLTYNYQTMRMISAFGPIIIGRLKRFPSVTFVFIEL